jgi:hypothetical protein
MVGWYISEELERIRKETVIDCSNYYPGVFMKLLRKTGARPGVRVDIRI